ncbi:MAG: tetratricopeptide repeat protein [Pelistega sp.]|nr:tetratricopeptide repeat protein [Pelistega sp.]
MSTNQEVFSLMDQSNLLSEQKKYDDAITLAMQAWNLLPAPKESSEYFGWVVNSLINDYFDQKKYAQAHEWALEFVKGKKYRQVTDGEYFWLAIINYEMGNYDEAFEYFQKELREDKYAFENAPKKYVKFFNERKQ